jgi:hypothetical protein
MTRAATTLWKGLALMQGILQRAKVWSLPSNPVADVGNRRPPHGARR